MENETLKKGGEQELNAESRSARYFGSTMAMCGYMLLMLSAMMIMFIAFKYYFGKREIIDIAKDQNSFSFLIHYYTLELLLLLGALITGNFGLRLLLGANPNKTEIIPAKDRALLEPLIKESNKEAINQYVILSSLTGFTGTFQKIGFSGLPLATVTLTLIFSVLSFVDADFMELVKLTLGAFIGSFVQKGQDNIKLSH